ncbi:MAG: phosphoribosylamine--glycine ligase [Euzebyales bacterium]|nr:phosphoribosylamine--glycine ligase [Euzebyales bacterium]
MKVLVLGGGGREHALCWALGRAASVDEVLCAPGNAGIAEVARCVEVDPTDLALVLQLALGEGVDLVVVGPEAPLAAGVADTLGEAGVATFGPSRAAARIEASKAFCKQVMAAAGVPTAGYWTGTDPGEAVAALDRFLPPYVVKADGLAAGKGVRICAERAEAEEAIREAMVERVFGDAGARLVIEEFLDGPEVSAFGLADGAHSVLLATARDYKRALDGDQGRNTGGMGAVSPAPDLPAGLRDWVRQQVLAPVTAELAGRGLPYVGVLYAGLVLTADGPKVLEFNARFGDPEAQVVLPRLASDLGELLRACAHGELAGFGELAFHDRAAVTVVLASGGYPGPYETGLPITGLEAATERPDALVFHAGTRRDGDQVVTAGGRVLTVTGLGADVHSARAAAYTAADRIHFARLHRRADIAAPR